MAEVSATDRDQLKDSDFAYVDSEGDRHLPIHDESHVRNAAARFSHTSFESAADKRRAATRVVAAADEHGVELDDDAAVSRAARR